jgi:hypothetical protein
VTRKSAACDKLAANVGGILHNVVIMIIMQNINVAGSRCIRTSFGNISNYRE